jgi:septal ring factor EnvC (AmiA/AmiB activator)
MTLELKKIKDENKSLQKKLAELTAELQTEKHRLYEQEIKMYEIRREKDIMQISFEEMLKENPHMN